MQAKEQLLRMLRIQELAIEVARARKVIADAPDHIEEIEERFRDRNVEYVALKDRYDDLDRDQRDRNTELVDLEETKNKYTADLMQVQNQREYAATLKEIDSVKSRIAEHEDSILKAMEEMESLKPGLEKFTEEIAKEREQVGVERSEVEGNVAQANEELAAALAERERIESELSGTLLDNIRRIEEMRSGLFMAKVEDGMCQACYVRVRPQVAQEIRTSLAIHTCGQCRRFLYFEPSLKPPKKKSPRQDSDSSGVEAVNGGAV